MEGDTPGWATGGVVDGVEGAWDCWPDGFAGGVCPAGLGVGRVWPGALDGGVCPDGFDDEGGCPAGLEEDGVCAPVLDGGVCPAGGIWPDTMISLMKSDAITVKEQNIDFAALHFNVRFSTLTFIPTQNCYVSVKGGNSCD